MELIICMMIMLISFSFLRVSSKFVDDISLQYETVYLVNELRDIQKRSKINLLDNTLNGKYKDKVSIINYHEYRINKMGTSEIHRLPDDIFIRSNRTDILFYGDTTANSTTILFSKGKSKIKIIIDTVGRIRIMR